MKTSFFAPDSALLKRDRTFIFNGVNGDKFSSILPFASADMRKGQKQRGKSENTVKSTMSDLSSLILNSPNGVQLAETEVIEDGKYIVCRSEGLSPHRCAKRFHCVPLEACNNLCICQEYVPGKVYYVHGFGRFQIAEKRGASSGNNSCVCLFVNVDGHCLVVHSELVSSVKFFREFTAEELAPFSPDSILVHYRRAYRAALSETNKKTP